MVSLAQTSKDIKSLKIQGATNVTKASLDALSQTPESELAKVTDQLLATRPTEPLLNNCLALVNLKGKSVIPLLQSRLDDIQEEIIKNGLPLIKNGSSILTHCHSSTVVSLLKYAKKRGLEFSVYLTETRPVFQGRITAGELTEAGIAATMITDSEAAFLISKEDKKDVDVIFLGADAVLKDGSVFNKVGSYGIALAASKANVPVYVLTTLLKFSLKPVMIEERETDEVWKDKPKGLKIFNPAFDKIPADLIRGLVTEFGIIDCKKAKSFVKKNYPWIIKKLLRSPSGNSLRYKTCEEPPGAAFVPQKFAGLPAVYASPYKQYLHLEEKVNPKNHILAEYLLEAEEGRDFAEVAGGIAAESSVGTWTEVATELKNIWEKMHARVLEADEETGRLRIAYPVQLFEPGNIPQLLSSVAGNIYGLKEVKTLKLLDLDFPEVYIKGFAGPAIGIEGIRKISRISSRPLVGCIIKPKLGLDEQAHFQVAKEVFSGGVDFVKDDENLTSQDFNQFEKRVSLIMEYLVGAGLRNKIYAFNVTAPTELMLKRASFVKERKGSCLMVDFLTAGFSALQTLRNQNLGLIIHAHRAMHAALDRLPCQGISMLVLGKLARLAGVDSLHTGTVLGKMEGGENEVNKINRFLLSSWYGLKSVLPVASGGLYPGLVPELIKILGKDVLLNFGGGIHGHPRGPRVGATAVLQAVQAAEKEISLKNYARDHSELKIALNHWSKKI